MTIGCRGARWNRLETAFSGRAPDRTPILAGWIACPEHIAALAGVDIDQYWSDPRQVSVRAYERLDVDGLIDLFVPKHKDDFRCVDSDSYMHAEISLTIEDALARIDAMPTAEQIEAQFDLEAAYAAFRSALVEGQTATGDLVWMPAQWDAGAVIEWYQEFGYELFFEIFGAHPERARKLLEVGGVQGYCRCQLIARAVAEGLYPHAVLLGEDICTQRGPMISPQFMERYYAPQLRRGLQPLLAVGCRPVWHCDGDVRPILDMLIDCGVQGLQGFQPECGMTIDWLVQKRTRDAQPLVIFGPLAVTTELPMCTPREIRAKVRHAIEVCRGNANLVVFTSNTMNPDVPLANIIAMYEEAHTP